MTDVALYRKYRPQSFDEVVGQDHIVSALAGSLKTGSVSHAYLFYGTRGTGKTSVARILARELGANDADIHEIDAATYTQVEHMRALREEALVLPFGSKRKVYIVDEVHMLSKSSFNAFLKLLEEPPAHVVFILATTELDRVPDTIQSRCQLFTFRKPTQKALVESVTRIAKAEGFTLEKSSAELIALLADGSFRDSLSILQKILSTSRDKKVSVEEVLTVTGAPRVGSIHAVLEGMAANDANRALSALNEAADADADMEAFCMILINRVRLILMLRYAPTRGQALIADIADAEQKFLIVLAEDTKSKINSETLRKLLIASTETARSPVPQLPLELAILELVGAEK